MTCLALSLGFFAASFQYWLCTWHRDTHLCHKKICVLVLPGLQWSTVFQWNHLSKELLLCCAKPLFLGCVFMWNKGTSVLAVGIPNKVYVAHSYTDDYAPGGTSVVASNGAGWLLEHQTVPTDKAQMMCIHQPIT